MSRFLRQHAALSLAFVAALLLTAVFLARFVVSTIVWSDPDRMAQPVAGWMTPRYVARSWQVEPDWIAGVLELQRDGTGRRMTLEQIAAAQGRSPDDLLRTLDAALRDARGGADD